MSSVSRRTVPASCQIGADAAITPSTTLGYFIRNQPASIPPYEPPKATTGARTACCLRSEAMMVTQSAIACAVVQYAKQRCEPSPHSAGCESGSYRCSAKTRSAPSCSPSSHISPVLFTYSSTGLSLPV